MLTVPVGRRLIDLITLCYRAAVPLLLEGRHGIGKSEIVAQAAQELGIKFVALDLSVMEPPDLVGLPTTTGDVTRYAPPSILPTSGNGLLMLEELNRCQRYMRSPALQLLTARTLNEYRLPDGWQMVAAVNPAAGEYQTDDLDPALLSRFVRVEVVPDRDEWLSWARKAGIHTSVITYAEQDESIFDGDGNPRAWAYVSRLVRAADPDPVSREILLTAVAGLVGPERAVAFDTFLDGGIRPLTLGDLQHYAQRRKDFLGWVESGRLDLVEASLRNVKVALQKLTTYEEARQNKSLWRDLARFFSDLPPDLCDEARIWFHDHEYDFPLARVLARR